MRRILLLLCMVRAMVSLSQDGSVDLTFNPWDNGTYGDGFYTVGPPSGEQITSSCLQPDGKIILVGGLTRFNTDPIQRTIRLNVDGSVDPTFDPGTSANDIVRAVVRQPDGKVIIAGDFTTVDGAPCGHVARLHPDGALDTTFHFTIGANGDVKALALQVDGRILIGGYFDHVEGVPRARIARLNNDGSLDPTFDPGTGPLVNTPTSGVVHCMAVQDDGRVLIGGYFLSVNGVQRGHIARLYTDGSLDTTFVSIPGATGDGNSQDAHGDVYAVALAQDGKVYIGGEFVSYNGVSRWRVARLNTDGTLDPSFNAGCDLRVRYIVPDSNGGAFLAGRFTLPVGSLIKVQDNGSMDSTFLPGPVGPEVRSLQIRPDGRIVALGTIQYAFGITRGGVVGFMADGTRDMTFNPGAGIGIGTGYSCAVIQDDGRILVGGYFTSYNGIARRSLARLLPDGDLDTSFVPGAAPSAWVRAIAVQPDGKVVIGGSIRFMDDPSYYKVVRFNVDGSLDSVFQRALTTHWGGVSAQVRAVVLLSDGKLLVGGDFDTVNGTISPGIVRLHSDGTIDSTFNSHFDIGTNPWVFTIAVQPDGRILVGGVFTEYQGSPRNDLVRLFPDGTLDPTFDAGAGPDGFYDGVSALCLLPNGDLLVGGGYDTFDGVPASSLVRLDATGELDTTFVLACSSGRVLSITYQEDLKVLVGGELLCSDQGGYGLVRLNTDGSMDNTFLLSTIMWPWARHVSSISLDPQDRIFITGEFTTYAGYPRHRLARLINDLPTVETPAQEIGEVTVVPNPSNGAFRIDGHFEGSTRMEAFDVFSRSVTVLHFSADASDAPVIDLSGHAPGVYLLKITTGRGTLTTRLVKQ